MCVIEQDSKNTTELKAAAALFAAESKLEFINFKNFAELDTYLELNSDSAIGLLVVSSELIQNISAENILIVKEKYKTNIVITAFDDPLKPFKKTELWPIENIIYKPFDLPILQEHLRFAAVHGIKLSPLAVHSSKENFKIEKLRRYTFLALSDFGFKIKADIHFEIGQAYKFYHFIFQDGKKMSLWVKPINKTNDVYDFIFCYPSKNVAASLRKKSTEMQNRLKNINFSGYEKNKFLKKIKIGLQLDNQENTDTLKNFFKTKYPDAEIVEIKTDIKNPSQENFLNLIISEIKYETKYLHDHFGPDAIYFRVTNDTFKNRDEAELALASESVRLQKPIDRYYLSQMLSCYFPALNDTDPNVSKWFSAIDEALYSQMIVAKEFSEAAFVYDRETILAHSGYQEFFLPHEDENELKLLKAKIQYSDEKAQSNKMFAHQVVFYGIRDNLLKKIRMWMLQNYIDKKSAE